MSRHFHNRPCRHLVCWFSSLGRLGFKGHRSICSTSLSIVTDSAHRTRQGFARYWRRCSLHRWIKDAKRRRLWLMWAMIAIIFRTRRWCLVLHTRRRWRGCFVNTTISLSWTWRRSLVDARSCGRVQLVSFIDLCAAYGTLWVHIAAFSVPCYVNQTLVAHIFVATR